MKILSLILFLLSIGFAVQQSQLSMGRYSVIKKHKTLIIQIKADSTFVYYKGSNLYSYGKWVMNDNYLTILPPELTTDDSIRNALSGGSFFKIEKMCFLIEENAIVDIETKIKYKREK
jgi:hypothetical protein